MKSSQRGVGMKFERRNSEKRKNSLQNEKKKRKKQGREVEEMTPNADLYLLFGALEIIQVSFLLVLIFLHRQGKFKATLVSQLGRALLIVGISGTALDCLRHKWFTLNPAIFFIVSLVDGFVLPALCLLTLSYFLHRKTYTHFAIALKEKIAIALTCALVAALWGYNLYAIITSQVVEKTVGEITVLSRDPYLPINAIAFVLHSIVIACCIWKRFKIGVSVFLFIDIAAAAAQAVPNPTFNFQFSNLFEVFTWTAFIWLDLVVFPVSLKLAALGPRRSEDAEFKEMLLNNSK
jgi:hypothetical protein